MTSNFAHRTVFLGGIVKPIRKAERLPFSAPCYVFHGRATASCRFPLGACLGDLHPCDQPFMPPIKQAINQSSNQPGRRAPAGVAARGPVRQ